MSGSNGEFAIKNWCSDPREEKTPRGLLDVPAS
jgi:hypothetical protein